MSAVPLLHISSSDGSLHILLANAANEVFHGLNVGSLILKTALSLASYLVDTSGSNLCGEECVPFSVL